MLAVASMMHQPGRHFILNHSCCVMVDDRAIGRSNAARPADDHNGNGDAHRLHSDPYDVSARRRSYDAERCTSLM